MLANRLANREVFLTQITAGCKHNSAQLDKWLEILAMKHLTWKEPGRELKGEQQRRPQCIHRQPILSRRVNKHGIMQNGFEILI